jgi:hypothetical protein
MTAAADHGSSLLTAFTRAAGFALLAIGAALALVFAFAAAVVVGVMILGAALAMRLAPRPASTGAAVLEARRTPAGWVVETRS